MGSVLVLFLVILSPPWQTRLRLAHICFLSSFSEFNLIFTVNSSWFSISCFDWLASECPAGHLKWRERACSVCAAEPLIPILADAETVGGNALNVQRTMKDLIATGAAGCFLEVIPAEEHAAKVASARDAIGYSDFFLVARTDAHATSAKHSLADAVSWANLYMEVLMLALLKHQVMTRNSKEIGRQTKGYIVCNMLEGGFTPLHTPEELKAMGFHLIARSLTTLYASARAMLDILKTLKHTGSARGSSCQDGYL